MFSVLDYEILDTPQEQAFDDITWLCSQTFDVPICVVTLLHESRQWFKSKVGLSINETPVEQSFCSHALECPNQVFVINDAAHDSRFCNNPLVKNKPHIRFYAGAPLVPAGCRPLGTLCVIDHRPRPFSEHQRRLLLSMARQVVNQLELRKTFLDLAKMAAQGQLLRDRHELVERTAAIGNWEFDFRRNSISWSNETYRIFGQDPNNGAPAYDEIMQLHPEEDQMLAKQAVVRALQTGEPYNLELRVRRGGEMVKVQVYGECRLDADGKPCMLVGTIKEVAAASRSLELAAAG